MSKWLGFGSSKFQLLIDQQLACPFLPQFQQVSFLFPFCSSELFQAIVYFPCKASTPLSRSAIPVLPSVLPHSCSWYVEFCKTGKRLLLFLIRITVSCCWRISGRSFVRDCSLLQNLSNSSFTGTLYFLSSFEFQFVLPFLPPHQMMSSLLNLEIASWSCF